MESISRISSLLESGMKPPFSRTIQIVERVLTYTTARELTLDAAQSARSSRSSIKTLSPVHIKKLLDSRNDREVLEGLRRVISVRLLFSFGDMCYVETLSSKIPTTTALSEEEPWLI
jgi:hypothetical protein